VAAEVETFQLDPNRNFILDKYLFTQTLCNGGHDCAILTNPHNPSGALLRSGELMELMERIRAAGAFVLVDEAFIDYAPDETIVSHAIHHSGIAVLRSLTKFFGCPALRVGYMIGSSDIIQRVARTGPTWPVTTLAANSLQVAVEDEGYASRSLRENETERSSLVESLTRLGAQVVPSAANFLLIRLRKEWPDSSYIREFLIRNHRILVRNCDSFVGLEKGRYIRVAVRTAEDNARLLQGLREIWP
jgi:threonine-phosphate decarboxylase